MSKKILLIEYEPRYLDRIRGHLAGKDFDLVVAKDGEEGLEAYRRGRPDVVLISTVLPKLRTRDVIRGMQALGPVPPIILMTSGYKGKDKHADAQREGGTSILEKPFSEDQLLAEVSSVLGTTRASEPFPSAGEPLLSSDDIFSDVLSGMEDEEPVKAAPAAPAGTDPGIQKKLEQTLSGILARPGKAAPAPAPKSDATPKAPAESAIDRTLRMEIGLDAPAAPKPAERPAPTVDSAVDRMLTQTLSGLRPVKAEKTGPIPPVSVPKSPASGVSRAVTPAPEPKAAPAAAPAASPAATSRAAEPSQRPAQAPAPASAPSPEPRKRAEATLAPGSHFGRYQLLEKIAAGGMAEVYKARMRGEEGFEKIVAIKRILPHMADNDDFITMFIDEAKLAAQLTHPNIIHIYDLGKVDQYHYIAMEYVEGKDLRSILKLGAEKGYPLPTELALFIAAKIANALDYAHRRVGLDGKELDLVHRDVSPQNVLISFEGDIKLCDFGIAKAATKVGQTQAGALKGKLQYMSPEQAWGKKVDRRTDIFSLGIVLGEMLTGERMFNGDTDLTILEQVRDARVEPPSLKNPEVPKKVDQIVLKALAKSPADRYQNASEFEKELNSVLYSFQPAPGPADLAIYMHRLVEAAAVASEESIDAAFDSVAAGPVPEEKEKKKGKGLIISKKAPAEKPAPEPEKPAPAPVELSAPALTVGTEAGKSRTGLYAGIAIALVALVAGGIYLAGGKKEAAPTQAVPTPAPAVVETPAAPAGPTPAPEKVIDQKALEAEAKRLAAEQAKALREAAQKGAAPAPTAAAAPAPVGLAPSRPLQPPKAEVAPAAAPTAVPVPTQAPRPAPTQAPPPPTQAPAPPVVAAPPAPAPAAAAAEPALKEGDLVGPGEGVVEPRIVRLGSFGNLPPEARQIQRRRGEQGIGTVLVLALVNEKGKVTEARIVRPSAYKFVDEAAVAAIKSSSIAPATKNGIKVKMWKTFSITVQP